MDNNVSYAESIQEIESIAKEIEGDKIDVDTLAHKVKRAADLIKLCKAKLSKTENEVKDILTEMEAGASEDAKQSQEELSAHDESGLGADIEPF